MARFYPIAILIISCSVICSSLSFGTNNFQDKAILSPQVTTFRKNTYDAENQNWDIGVAESGAIYFANSLGLLKYDGEDWNLYKTKNILRSVYCQGDTIYVGGNGLIGYFLENDLKSGFHSLSEIDNDIWKIFPLGDRLIFQSFNRLYHLDNYGRIGVERIQEGNITYAYQIDDYIFCQVSYGKLKAFKPNSTELVLRQPDELSNYQIKFISKLDEYRFLLGTLENGLFILEENRLTPIDNELNTLLKKYQLNKAIELDNNTFAFATMNGGVVIGSIDGKINFLFNTSDGLSNNRIHALKKQGESNLWIGTDNGIALVDLNSSLLYLRNSFDKLGSVYDLVQQNGNYYIATNQGLFTATRSETQDIIFGLKIIEGSEGQVWNVSIIDHQLFVGHNKGTFLLENNRLIKLSDVAGGYSIVQSKLHPDLIYQTSYYGVAIYRKVNMRWKFSHLIEGLNDVTRDLVELNDGSLIVGGTGKNVYQIKLNAGNSEEPKIENLGLREPFNISMWTRVFRLNQQTLLVANDTTLAFNKGRLEPVDMALNKKTFIYDTSTNDYVFLRSEKGLEIYNSKTKTNVLLPAEIQNIGLDLIYKYEHISDLGSNIYACSLSENLVFLNLNRLKSINKTPVEPTITNVVFSNNRTGEISDLSAVKQIPYQFNTVKITYTSFRYNTSSVYEYYLKGYNDEWLINNKNNQTVFQNLREGRYTFRVKELGSDLQSEFSFVIAPPFYRSKVAVMIYLLFFIILFFVVQRISVVRSRQRQLYRLKKERQRINELRIRHAKQVLDLEVVQLQNEVESKTDKLTNLLLQNNKKKEVIDTIKEELKNLKESNKFVSSRHIEKLNRIIKSNFDEKKDWLVFESAFSETHVNFFKQLKAKHPILTDEDLRLCAYLKVNLSSKELAPIFQITTRSVDLKKYRLKKKLQLDKEQSLSEYIKNFNY
ncbi:triple tyrosine motif-containing protein [Prolixibacteraceae bacterium Z1-6]|uniref:Triple tyrosine motif-containing protein n=1 Tax=Draconibacterium aestuarii TaxID=2998507 RepID=A0A9X3F4V8_9BACT|nr:triple tyrosine motif-containing protein [Prolixibacteraceae bacterium Z1-6]